MRDLVHILTPHDLLAQFTNIPDKLRAKRPVSWEQAYRLWHLYSQIQETRTTNQAKETIRAWLKRSLPVTENPYRQLQQAIIAAKDFREALVEDFVPDAIRFLFTSEGLVRATNDPVELLKLCWAPAGDQHYNGIRSFEANVFWQLGNRYLLMNLLNETTAVRLPQITLWLENELFHSGLDEIQRQETINIVYDPNNENRFVEITQGQPENVLRMFLWVRLIKTADRVIKVLYDGREKTRNGIFRKSLLKSQGEQPFFSDQSAISLVCLSDQDVEDLNMLLMTKIFPNASVISNFRINGQGGKKVNQHTPTKSLPDKHFVVMTPYGQLEVQIFTFENYFNRNLSCGEENHRLYGLRRILPLIQLFFPKELYVDWQNPEIASMLKNFQLNMIRTNFQSQPRFG